MSTGGPPSVAILVAAMLSAGADTGSIVVSEIAGIAVVGGRAAGSAGSGAVSLLLGKGSKTATVILGSLAAVVVSVTDSSGAGDALSAGGGVSATGAGAGSSAGFAISGGGVSSGFTAATCSFLMDSAAMGSGGWTAAAVTVA